MQTLVERLAFCYRQAFAAPHALVYESDE